MNRIKDYCGFAIWFVGLGYGVLWPVTSSDLGGRPFGASIFCHDGSPTLLDWLCNSARPLQLPPALHALGFLSAVFVTGRLLVYALRRSRRAGGSGAAGVSALAARIEVEIQKLPQRTPAPPLRPVRPRTQFGLRGIPR